MQNKHHISPAFRVEAVPRALELGVVTKIFHQWQENTRQIINRRRPLAVCGSAADMHTKRLLKNVRNELQSLEDESDRARRSYLHVQRVMFYLRRLEDNLLASEMRAFYLRVAEQRDRFESFEVLRLEPGICTASADVLESKRFLR